jgi:hypothetical protein
MILFYSFIQDPFRRHLKYDNLQPFSSYRIFLVMHNIYTVAEPVNLLFIPGITTKEGVPDPVATLSAVGSGVTCIDVFWSGPDNLRGPIDNKAYFLTYRGGSFDLSVDVGTNMFLSLNDLTPDVEYMIEVKVSNGVLNSSIIAVDASSWPRAPSPGYVQRTNTSMTLTLELEDVHVNISSVFIEVRFAHMVSLSTVAEHGCRY